MSMGKMIAVVVVANIITSALTVAATWAVAKYTR